MPDHMYEQYGERSLHESFGDSQPRFDFGMPIGPAPAYRRRDVNARLDFDLDLLPDAAPSPSYAGRGPAGYQRPDALIREKVCEGLMQDGHLDARGIEIEVHRGVVILSGTALSHRARRVTEEIADSVYGVMNVHNRIRVRASREAE